MRVDLLPALANDSRRPASYLGCRFNSFRLQRSWRTGTNIALCASHALYVPRTVKPWRWEDRACRGGSDEFKNATASDADIGRLRPPIGRDERICLSALTTIFLKASLKTVQRHRTTVQRDAKRGSLSFHF